MAGSIRYSPEPTSIANKDKAKLGILNWEFDLQKGAIPHEKGMFSINLTGLPSGNGRIMLIRVRVRDDYSDGSGTEIGDFGEIFTLKIIGKPGNLFSI